MSLLAGIMKGQAIRSLDPQTDPVQPLKTRVVDYINSSGNPEGHRLEVFLYNNSGSAIAAGDAQTVVYDGDEETNPGVIDPATSAITVNVVVAVEAIASAAWGWFAFEGHVNALVDGTTDMNKDDYIKATNGQVYLVEDTTSKTAKSLGIYCDADFTTDATQALKKIYLFGREVTI